MQALDFIKTARDLVDASGIGRPRETNLRRAVSAAYYALFHCLAQCCADTLVGGAGSDRSQPAWNQAYRALQHRTARRRCERRAVITRFPDEIQDFASHFAYMQAKRHDADYNPDASFSKADVAQGIDDAERAIMLFNEAPIRDRRAFAVYVLLDIRNA